jgi:hypothetical protein
VAKELRKENFGLGFPLIQGDAAEQGISEQDALQREWKKSPASLLTGAEGERR